MGAFGNPGSGHGLDLALRLQLFQRRVQNSERFVEAQFDPTGTGSYSLSPVFGAPSFDEGNSHFANVGEVVSLFVATSDFGAERLFVLTVAEQLYVAASRNLHYSRRMPTVRQVANRALYKYGRL